MPEVKVCPLPSSVALEVGTARVPAPLALALPSLPSELPHGASMLGLYALTPSVTRVGCPGRTRPQGEAGRGGHPGPRAPRPAAGHPQRGPGGTCPSPPWSCAHMTALPGLPFAPSFPAHSRTSFRVPLNAVLRAACSPLLPPSGPAGASGQQTRAHQLSSHLLTAQLCVCPSVHEGTECEEVGSRVGSHAACHTLRAACRVSACLLTGVCKLHECAVCSARGIAGSAACVLCLCVRGTRGRPSTQRTARVSCSQTERLHRTGEALPRTADSALRRPTPVVSAPRRRHTSRTGPRLPRGAFCSCPRAVFSVFGGKWRAVFRTSYGSQQASRVHLKGTPSSETRART